MFPKTVHSSTFTLLWLGECDMCGRCSENRMGPGVWTMVADVEQCSDGVDANDPKWAATVGVDILWLGMGWLNWRAWKSKGIGYQTVTPSYLKKEKKKYKFKRCRKLSNPSILTRHLANLKEIRFLKWAFKKYFWILGYIRIALLTSSMVTSFHPFHLGSSKSLCLIYSFQQIKIWLNSFYNF